MKKLTRILLVVLTLTILAMSVSSCSLSEVKGKITDWIDKVYDYVVTGCVHEGGTATCTEKAICKICGRAYGKPLGHTPETIEGVSPTCTESGITDGSRCKVCGEILESQKPLSALGHTYGEWTVTKPATCTENGERERACEICNEKETEVILSSGHSWSEWVATTPATCTAGGENKRTCTCEGCDAYETQPVSAKGHTEEVKLGKEATCTESGLTDGVYCSACEKWIVAQKTIPASKHDYEETVVSAGCETQGYTLHKCKNCSDEYKTDYTLPTGHSFGEWTVTKNATCTEEGEKTRACACGKTETMPVAKTAHTYTSTVTAPTCTEMGYTTHTCSCGDSYKDTYVNSKGHSFGEWTVTTEPTCTEAGVQTRKCSCGKTETMPVGATGHSYSKATTAPTCTEQGYTTYTCKCGDSYVTDYVPAKGHSFTGNNTKCDNCDYERGCQHVNRVTLDAKEPTCTEDGLTEGTKCKDCGEILDAQQTVKATGHDYKSTVTAPTCTESGYTTNVCGKCGNTYVSDYVSATGHSFGEWTQTKAPTCTEAGVQTRTCSSCSKTETMPVGATGHSYSKVTTAPTCTKQGYTTYTCSCSYSYKGDYVAALGHTATQWTQTKAPTCTEEGEVTGKCTREGCTEGTVTYKVAALGHNYQGADCMHEGVCTRCGDVGEKDLTKHTDGCVLDTSKWYSDGKSHWHQYTECGQYADEQEHFGGKATCENPGKCSECYTEYIEAPGHNKGDITYDDNYHWYTCKNEGCTAKLYNGGHTFGGWVTDSDSHWMECECGKRIGEEYHNWETRYDETHHWTVCGCGKTTETVEHTWVWDYDDTTHKQICSCGSKRNEGNHSYSEGLCECGRTEDNTLRISTVDDLIKFKDAVNGGKTYAGWTVYLVTDISFENIGYDFDGIGAKTIDRYGGCTFCGTFDGCGHTVSTFTVASTGELYATAGFFNSLGDGAVVKNLTICDAYIISSHYAGGLVGYWAGNVTISDCNVVNSSISSWAEEFNGEYDGGDKVGGIVGYASVGGTIENCTVKGSTDMPANCTGGLVLLNGYRDIGGVAGCITAGVTVKNCKAPGELELTITVFGDHDYQNYGSDKTKYNVGGIVGRNLGGTVTGCSNETPTINWRILCGSGHTYGTLISKVDATCVATGVAAHYECSKCGKYFDENQKETTLEALTIAVNPDNHSFGEWHDEVPATCTTEGTKGYKDCTLCNKHFDNDGNEITDLTIGKLNHTYNQQVATEQYLASAATCQAKAKYYYSCSCGATGTDTFEKGELGAHNVGEWINEVAATCTAEGTKGHYVCSVCQKNLDFDKTTVLETLTIDKDPANHSGTLENYESDVDNHWQRYSCCDATTEKVAHSYDENGECVCGREQPQVHEHTYTAVAGVEGLFTCTCGKEFKVDSTKTTWNLLTDITNLTAGSKIVIAAKDYNYALSTTQNSNNRKAVEITKSEDGKTITIGDDVQIITVEVDGTNFLFNVGNDAYLYAAGGSTGSNNHMKTDTKTTVGKNGIWSIEVSSTDGDAVIKTTGDANRNRILFNNGSSKLISCYEKTSTNVKEIVIYIQHIEYTEVPEHICSDNVTGATCTEDGKCSVCGRTVADSALGHDYDSNGECTHTGCTSTANVVYLDSNMWNTDKAWFAAYVWADDVDAQWIKMEVKTGSIYYAIVPDGMTKVIFCRMDPAKNALSWDSKWNQTEDTALSFTDKKAHYTVVNWSSGADGKSQASNVYTAVGNFSDWAPDKDAYDMTFDSKTGLYGLYFTLDAGSYEVKVAVNHSWEVSYGPNGGNVAFSVAEDGSLVHVTFDFFTKEVKADVHAHSYTYTVNGDEHTKTCSCGISETKTHTYVDGYCECGAMDSSYTFSCEIADLTSSDSKYLNHNVTFTGTVTKINTAWSDQYNNISFTVSDANGNSVYVFRCGTNVELCDVVTITGKFINYTFDSGSTMLEIETGATATIGDKNHTFGDWVEKVNATCTADGTAAHKDCTVCGKHFDADGKELTDERYNIEATGHNYENGTCTICGTEESAVQQTTTTEGFTDITTNGNYSSGTSSSGWTYKNAAIKQITKNVYHAIVINGKTTDVGTLTSPTLFDGISKLTFNYTNQNSEKNGVDITVYIKDTDGNILASKQLDNDSVEKNTEYTFEWTDLNVKGDYIIYIENNCPTNSTSNKDRVAIWNIQYTTNK